MYFKISFSTLSNTVHFDKINVLTFKPVSYLYFRIFINEEKKEAYTYFYTLQKLFANIKYLDPMSYYALGGVIKKQDQYTKKLSKLYVNLLSFDNLSDILKEINSVYQTNKYPLLDTILIKTLEEIFNPADYPKIYLMLLETPENEREKKLESIQTSMDKIKLKEFEEKHLEYDQLNI